MAQCPDQILCRTGGHWQLLRFRYGNGESAAFYPTTNYTSVLPGRGRPAGREQNQRHPHCAPPGVACNNTDCDAISRGDLPCNRTAPGLAMSRPETGAIPLCRLIQPVDWQTMRPIDSLVRLVAKSNFRSTSCAGTPLTRQKPPSPLIR